DALVDERVSRGLLERAGWDASRRRGKAESPFERATHVGRVGKTATCAASSPKLLRGSHTRTAALVARPGMGAKACRWIRSTTPEIATSSSSASEPKPRRDGNRPSGCSRQLPGRNRPYGSRSCWPATKIKYGQQTCLR